MKPKARKIIGIDPGYGRLGWAVIEATGSHLKLAASGCIETKGKDIGLRLLELYQKLSVILDRWQPAEASMEQLFMNHNVTTAIGVGQARGVVMLALAQRHISLREFSPSMIKSAVVGYGRAEKTQVQRMMKILLNLPRPPASDDEADAMAISICAANRQISHAT